MSVVVQVEPVKFVYSEVYSGVSQGRSPACEKQLAKVISVGDSTLREFGERYFKEVVEKDRKDSEPVRRYLNREIYPVLGDRLVRDITAADPR